LSLLSSVDFRHAFGHKVGQTVAFRQGQLLHARHIFYSAFGSHGAVSDDAGHLFLSVFLGHVTQHVGSSVIIEVNVYIRQ